MENMCVAYVGNAFPKCMLTTLKRAIPVPQTEMECCEHSGPSSGDNPKNLPAELGGASQGFAIMSQASTNNI